VSKTMTAAFVLLMAASLPVYAQTTSNTPNTTPSASSTSAAAPSHAGASHIQPGQIRATEMDGATVYDTQNQKVGDVKDIILDKDGKVAAVVLDVGAFLGMGGKYVAVGMNDIKITEDKNNKPHFAVEMTKDQLKAAQAFDLNRNTTASGSSTAPANRPAGERSTTERPTTR
jgi:sporulation protein YlmC with PRC-barrel domain